MSTKPMSVSVGICAYNEEANIQAILESISSQELDKFELLEIIVVSSGSTDSTEKIVNSFIESDSRVSLIVEPSRSGKAGAINLFLKAAVGEICIIQSADTVQLEGTLMEICSPFLDDEVGAVAGRPKQVKTSGIVSNFSTILWDLHEIVSRKKPKLGEISAHRNVFDSIPVDTIADDSYIEYKIQELGYKVVFQPNAVVMNKGPDNLNEYIKQRIRWRAAQIINSQRTGYTTGTMNSTTSILAMLQYTLKRPWKIPIIVPMCIIELYCLAKSKSQAKEKQNDLVVWERLATTKKNLDE